MKKIRGLNLSDVVFIDIETARIEKVLEKDTPTFDAWEYMVKRSVEERGIDVAKDYYKRAGLYPEFSRVVCITVGRLKDGELVIVTYSDAEEKELLEKFMGHLSLVVKKRPKTALCGHSVKGFDIPFIFRRCLVNGVVPNSLIDVGDVKPWLMTALDTKELWKGSGYYSASLVAVCLALGIPSPKGDIDGSEVGEVYHSEGENGLDRIIGYCERDVMAVANVVLKCRMEPILKTYTKVEPKKPAALGLIGRISKEGRITKEDEVEILQKVKRYTIAEKEKTIKIIKAALIPLNGVLSQNLELAILSA